MQVVCLEFENSGFKGLGLVEGEIEGERERERMRE
jgi:hypothetical protein